jgi:hypothetical protein
MQALLNKKLVTRFPPTVPSASVNACTLWHWKHKAKLFASKEANGGFPAGLAAEIEPAAARVVL